ncbi:MAG: 2-phosphosulfolactate phosphatase [Planctomycetaceae bacterium]|nr:2-phosphosulfolactate phosphatase [Planctomycetaceae bacterium]
MTLRISAHLLPALIPSDGLAGSCAVVIDLFRATTTISHALAAGARAVIPCAEIEEALQAASRFPQGQALLGGERNCVRISGFDLGNSPADYTRERVQGRIVVMSTTNGTTAIRKAATAERVITAALANLSAVVESILGEQRPVHIICSGTKGVITGEDVLCAGAIISAAASRSAQPLETNDCARMAASWYQQVTTAGADSLSRELRQSLGGRNLLAAGQEADIITAARVDTTSVLPEWNHTTGELTLA